jgi:hypothetical protein
MFELLFTYIATSGAGGGKVALCVTSCELHWLSVSCTCRVKTLQFSWYCHLLEHWTAGVHYSYTVLLLNGYILFQHASELVACWVAAGNQFR